MENYILNIYLCFRAFVENYENWAFLCYVRTLFRSSWVGHNPFATYFDWCWFIIQLVIRLHIWKGNKTTNFSLCIWYITEICFVPCPCHNWLFSSIHWFFLTQLRKWLGSIRALLGCPCGVILVRQTQVQNSFGSNLNVSLRFLTYHL